MKLTLGFSPCPNDTFIFDALVNQKIDTDGLEFEVMLEDVETLNQWALQGKLDVTKLSFPAFFQSLPHYILLSAGSALGKGAGPLLISKTTINNEAAVINNKQVAIPGENTTAHLLFSLAFPEATKKKFMLFSEIEEALLKNDVECGVIIHENRFTYQQKGLKKIIDLGEYWERKMNVPVPLGGIAVKRKFDNSIIQKLNHLIKKSLEYAYGNHPILPDYVKEHSQEMSEDVMRQHIQLYVNNFSIALGSEGKRAIEILYSVFRSTQQERKNLLNTTMPLFF